LYTILRFVTTGIEDPSQHLNDNVFDLNKLLSIQVFQDMDILEALLTCKGSFTKLHRLSLLSFSTDRQCSRKKAIHIYSGLSLYYSGIYKATLFDFFFFDNYTDADIIGIVDADIIGL
jgi:hypothetical protein